MLNYNGLRYSKVYWKTSGKYDGKNLIYNDNVNSCQRNYYDKGGLNGTWNGTDISEQYQTTWMNSKLNLKIIYIKIMIN